MAGWIKTNIKVDMTGFNRGFELALQYTKRTPSEACNFAGKEVAYGAYKNTAFVTPQTVDSELDVIVSPVIGKRGKPLKNRKSYGTGTRDAVPLAAMIVQARANPGSKINALTGGRYLLTASPFKGVSRAAGAAAMAALIDVMVKGRHRSGHFIAAGWLESIQVLKRLAPSRYGGKANVPPGQNVEELGSVIPAVAGQSNAFCVIENDVGLEGQNAASHNRALMQTTPALQSALDREGRIAMDYFLKKSGREELEIPVNKAWG